MFKTLLLTYKFINGLAPEYLSMLSELPAKYEQDYNLRSLTDTEVYDGLMLRISRTKLKCGGDRAFPVVAASLWICKE